jgi:hypothetical protein
VPENLQAARISAAMRNPNLLVGNRSMLSVLRHDDELALVEPHVAVAELLERGCVLRCGGRGDTRGA